MNDLFYCKEFRNLNDYTLNEKISLEVNLGHTYISKKEVLNMNEDDILILDTKIGNMLEVVCDNESKFYGIMCVVNDKKAIFLT